MTESTHGHRVLLDAKASQSLDKMLNTLKQEGEFIRINPNKLVSWIVENFHVNRFSSTKAEIAKSHFNPRAYLLNVASKATNGDEAKALLTDALAKLQINKKKKTKTKGSDEKLAEDH